MLFAQVQEPEQADESSVDPFQIIPSTGIDEASIILGEAPAASAIETASSFGVMLRMILVLALAALAIYGVVFFIKRLSRPPESRDPHLRVLARLPLANDSYAAVISVGTKAWLVGGGSGGIKLISEIDDVETLETMLIEDAEKRLEEESRGVFSFNALLEKFKRPSRENPGGESRSFADNLRKQRDRLKGH